MQLSIHIDGVHHQGFRLIDGNDIHNRSAEATCMDEAYELKERFPASVITIVVDLDGDLMVDLSLTRDEANEIAGALDTLAGLDEGDHTDYAELIRLRDKILATPGVH